MKIFVSGSLAYDRIMDFSGRFSEHILPDKIHSLNVSFLLDTFTENFGGTAGNIAYNLALLGEAPIVLAAAGNDFLPYRDWLEKNRVDTNAINIIPEEKTSFCYIVTDRADNQITAFYPGAMKFPAQPLAKELEPAMAIISPGYLAGMREYPGFYKKNNIPYIYDPGQQIPALAGDDLIAGISGAKAFISNDYELSLVMQKTGLSENDILAKTEILVTTLGEKGSIIKTGDAVYAIPPARAANASDPTGAGDAFRAGFIKGLAHGLPLETCGRLAATVAVYTVEKYGTQTHSFTMEELRERYEDNFKQALPI